MIFISTIANAGNTSLQVAAFHLFHLAAVSTLSSYWFKQSLNSAKIVLTSYVILIFFSEAIILLNLPDVVASFSIITEVNSGARRIAAFATEPAFAGLVMLIMSRFVLMHDPAWMTKYRQALILIAMYLTQSFISFLSALLLLAMLQRRMRYSLGWTIIGACLLLSAFAASGYFSQRVEGIDTSSGFMGMGSGTIRILPLAYLFEAITQNPLAIIIGAGAGSFQDEFFIAIGQYYTKNDQLSGHMAAIIYDYGIAAVAPLFFGTDLTKCSIE